MHIHNSICTHYHNLMSTESGSLVALAYECESPPTDFDFDRKRHVLDGIHFGISSTVMSSYMEHCHLSGQVCMDIKAKIKFKLLCRWTSAVSIHIKVFKSCT